MSKFEFNDAFIALILSDVDEFSLVETELDIRVDDETGRQPIRERT